MSNAFGYHSPGTIRNFKCLRSATLWAGGLGVIQSIIWIALTIVGIVAYNCQLSVNKNLTFGSVIEIIFFKLYFEGNCPADENNYTTLQLVHTVLDPTQILIWTCVYLGVAVCWLLASVLLFTHIKKNDATLTVGILYTWVFFTLSICMMDLALGIIFGIDYGQFRAQAYRYNLNSVNAGDIDPSASQLVAGMVTSISLMIISFKGFILWIINFGLVIYLLIRAIFIPSDKDGNDTLFMPRKESDDILTTRPPIHAYQEQKGTPAIVYSNEAFVPDDRSVGTIELNQESIARAARMSTDPHLQDRRFRNLEAFQQYPPPRASSHPAHRPEPVQTQESVVAVAAFPVPDYSPPMSRASQNQSGLVRNQRYQ